jgi:hypothetical protein
MPLIPWCYVISHYVTKPEDRWIRSIESAPADLVRTESNLNRSRTILLPHRILSCYLDAPLDFACRHSRGKCNSEAGLFQIQRARNMLNMFVEGNDGELFRSSVFQQVNGCVCAGQGHGGQ